MAETEPSGAALVAPACGIPDRLRCFLTTVFSPDALLVEQRIR
ncbi:hypothetical protein [Luteibacter anthropi]|nr:hypothetical protein [Luteibacter anthropi]